MKRILIISDYFGEWPKWFSIFLLSCSRNCTIDWLINTDCVIPDNHPSNVKFVSISKDEYNSRVSDLLGVQFRPFSMYNICNLRPMYGLLYEDHLDGYDYFGWCDIDVIFGDIRKFYDQHVLSHNVISASSSICTGHLMLIKNEPWLKEAFHLISGWKERLNDPGSCPWEESLDEAKLSAVFSPHDERRRRVNLSPHMEVESRYWNNNYFKEQWATVFTPWPWLDGNPLHPAIWFWKDGVLWNERDAPREFLYLHLMNFKAARYVNQALYKNAKTWDTLPRIIHFNDREIGTRTVRIDRSGFHLVES